MSGDPFVPGTGGPDDLLAKGGPVVALRNDSRGVVARSVQSLASLPPDLPGHALVGGLAVIVRLAEPHRATTDFDEVTAGREQAIGLLVERGAERRGSGVFLPTSGLQLDLLEAELGLDELLSIVPTDPAEAQAVEMAACARFALETAVDTRIVVLAPDDAAKIDAEVLIPVATAGALVAMKTHSARASSRAADKAASDCYDSYRLVRGWGIDVIVSDLAAAPIALRRLVAANISALFDLEVDRTRRLLRSSSISGTERIDVDELSSIGSVADRLLVEIGP